jgi:hypothetical protein
MSQQNYVTKAVRLFTPSEIVRIGKDLGIELPARGLRLLTEGEEIDTAKAFPKAEDQKAADLLFHAMAMGKIAHTGSGYILTGVRQPIHTMTAKPDPVEASDKAYPVGVAATPGKVVTGQDAVKRSLASRLKSAVLS